MSSLCFAPPRGDEIRASAKPAVRSGGGALRLDGILGARGGGGGPRSDREGFRTSRRVARRGGLKGRLQEFGLSWHAGDRLGWRAIVPSGGLSGRRRTDHVRSSQAFPASRFAGIPQRSLRNASRIGNGGLKGRLQPGLAATHRHPRSLNRGATKYRGSHGIVAIRLRIPGVRIQRFLRNFQPNGRRV